LRAALAPRRAKFFFYLAFGVSRITDNPDASCKKKRMGRQLKQADPEIPAGAFQRSA
jgi:hypothetical protein